MMCSLRCKKWNNTHITFFPHHIPPYFPLSQIDSILDRKVGADVAQKMALILFLRWCMDGVCFRDTSSGWLFTLFTGSGSFQTEPQPSYEAKCTRQMWLKVLRIIFHLTDRLISWATSNHTNFIWGLSMYQYSFLS